MRIATSLNDAGRLVVELGLGTSALPSGGPALFDIPVAVTGRGRASADPLENRANEAIYEREYVKRGGRGFSRKAAPSGAVRADGVGADLSRPPSRGGGREPPSSAVCAMRGRRDVFAQPSIRDRRSSRRRHFTGVQGTPPFNFATVVRKGRRRASLRGRPMVVTPARRRSTGGSLVVVQALLSRGWSSVRGSGQAAGRGRYGFESRSIA